VPDVPRRAAPDESGEASETVTAPTRILQAAARRVRAAGLVRLSMQAVADEAQVSKGLIHYHFRDRDALLARLIEWLAEDIMARERVALEGCAPHEAIDALWRWIKNELQRGELRVLLELQQDPAAGAALAARRVSRLRHAQAEATTTRLFEMLGLSPRVPAELMAAVAVAFLDGLAIETALQPDREARISFDVFWLALLSLAE
jgi:AcrR family transcriptional regulator